MRTKLFGFIRNDKGTQLVELALVIPLMLMIFAAVAEFGRYFYTYTTLAKGTRAGARYLINKPVGTETTAAKNLVVYGNLTGTGTPLITGLTTSNVTVTSTGGMPTAPDTITITITGYTFQPIFDLGKITGKPTLSMKIAVSPSTTMAYL
jgi:Flp pilus assembly protein TadG